MAAGPSETPIGEAVVCPFNSFTGPLTMLKPSSPSQALPPSQVPANWAVLQILAQSPKDENALGGTEFVGGEQSLETIPGSAAKPVGCELNAADYSALEARWIDRELAERAGLRRVDSLTGGEIVGRRNGNCAGILIPYFHPGLNRVRDYRLRRDQPDLEYDSSGTLKSRQKYLSPPGRSNMLYLVPGTPQSLLRNPELPIVITEGEFKTIAVWRLAHHGTSTPPRFVPLGVSGVYNWRGTIGKTFGAILGLGMAATKL